MTPFAQKRVPSFRICHRSSDAAPSRSAVASSCSGAPAARSSSVNSTASGWPTASSSARPKSLAAPEFQVVIRPWASVRIIAYSLTPSTRRR